MNIALHPHPARVTTEAFLAWPGDGSGRRFNLADGIARPMPPASHTHARLRSNAMALIARSIDAAGLDLSALVEGAVVPDLYAAGNDFVLATVALRCPVSALYRRTWLAQEA